MADGTPRPTWDVPQQPPTGASPRPSWEAPAPAAPEEPLPAAPAHAAPEPPPAAPAEPPRAARSGRGDQRLLVPVLIGLVSVTGAVVTWQSALAGEKATDGDRQAIAETVLVAQAAADVEIVVQDAIVRFAEHAASLVEAELLEADAERFRAVGNPAAAEQASIRAVEERAVAQRALEGAVVNLANYVDTTGDEPFFDSNRLRTDLLESVGRELQVDPEQTQVDANELRDESQRLVGWIIALVGAVVLLTFAQVSQRRTLRLGFLGTGTAVWIVATVLALWG